MFACDYYLLASDKGDPLQFILYLHLPIYDGYLKAGKWSQLQVSSRVSCLICAIGHLPLEFKPTLVHNVERQNQDYSKN